MSHKTPTYPLGRMVTLAATALLAAFLAACGSAPEVADDARGTWAGRPIGSAPAANPALKQALIRRANGEWQFFGQQVVEFRGTKESIPNVGAWEDDDARHSRRVSAYWAAVGKPRLDGMDCKEPWSAAFMSWVMQGAGVPRSQFQPASAHWVYLSEMVEEAGYPGRWFVPRRISDYSPQPGDLVCAYRNGARPYATAGYTSAGAIRGTPAHCDLVVAKSAGRLEVIGGNVRNSVSKSILELDSQGHVKPVPRRPWFLVMQNRL